MYLSTKYDPKYASQKAHNELGLKVSSSPSHVTWNRVAERAVAEAHGEPGQHDGSNGDNVDEDNVDDDDNEDSNIVNGHNDDDADKQ